MSVISCSNLSKQYDDVEALKNVELEVEEGEFFGLLGPNGAGKTTLLKILTCQLKKSEGKAEVFGLDTFTEFKTIKPKIAIVPEQESPPSFLTPREVLELVINIRQIEDSDIDYWLEFFELDAMEGRVCRNLSRGQKQKVMLASAFISKTKLMFLDEPFINLDPLVQSKVREWLKESQNDGSDLIRLALNNISASLGDGENDYLNLNDGSGSLIVSSLGVAGKFSASVSTSTGLDFALYASNFEVTVNTTGSVGTWTVYSGGTGGTDDGGWASGAGGGSGTGNSGSGSGQAQEGGAGYQWLDSNYYGRGGNGMNDSTTPPAVGTKGSGAGAQSGTAAFGQNGVFIVRWQ